jgi:hypothetical protein
MDSVVFVVTNWRFERWEKSWWHMAEQPSQCLGRVRLVVCGCDSAVEEIGCASAVKDIYH